MFSVLKDVKENINLLRKNVKDIKTNQISEIKILLGKINSRLQKNTSVNLQTKLQKQKILPRIKKNIL